MRHAIYFAPAPESLLHKLGSSWLGRDAFTGIEVSQPDLPGIAELTVEARRYGFHATLKPPFVMADDVEGEEVVFAVKSLSHSLEPIALALKVDLIDGFLALVPAAPCEPLDALAARCVRELDELRAPISEADIARRRAAGLSARQDNHLRRWGYPYVLEEFRFHMTLTRRLDRVLAGQCLPTARDFFAAALSEPIIIDALSLFCEPVPGAPFKAVSQFAFTAANAEAKP
jgi:putative phosphonate metabolism protein